MFFSNSESILLFLSACLVLYSSTNKPSTLPPVPSGWFYFIDSISLTWKNETFDDLEYIYSELHASNKSQTCPKGFVDAVFSNKTAFNKMLKKKISEDCYVGAFLKEECKNEGHPLKSRECFEWRIANESAPVESVVLWPAIDLTEGLPQAVFSPSISVLHNMDIGNAIRTCCMAEPFRASKMTTISPQLSLAATDATSVAEHHPVTLTVFDNNSATTLSAPFFETSQSTALCTNCTSSSYPEEISSTESLPLGPEEEEGSSLLLIIIIVVVVVVLVILAVVVFLCFARNCQIYQVARESSKSGVDREKQREKEKKKKSDAVTYNAKDESVVYSVAETVDS